MARGTEELQNQTRLQKRNGVYYFRIKVPVDLIPAYHPRRELKWSLGKLKTSE